MLVRKNFKRMRAHERQSSFRHHQSRGNYKSRKNKVKDGELPEGKIVPYETKPEPVTSNSPYGTKSALDICILPIDKEYCEPRPASMFIATSKYALKHKFEGNNRHSEISWQSYFADDSTISDLSRENAPQNTEAATCAIDLSDRDKTQEKVDDICPGAVNCSEIQQEFDSEKSSSSNISNMCAPGQTTEHASLHPNDLSGKKNRSKGNKVASNDNKGKGGSNNLRIRTPTFFKYNISLPRDDLRLTAMVFVVLASFILCWAPITIINFIETVLDSRVSRLMNIVAVYMMFLSAALNPIIYGLMNRNSRRAFYRIFCGWTRNCTKNKSKTGRNKISDVIG